MTEKVWQIEVNGVKVRRRLKKGWMERAKIALEMRSLSVEQEGARDRHEWRVIARMGKH